MGSGNGPKSYPIFGATREFLAKIGARWGALRRSWHRYGTVANQDAIAI